MKYLIYCLPLLLTAGLFADDDPNHPKRVALTISPAAEPVPALKYQLLPAVHERKPGNAAPFYYRALLNLKAFQLHEHWKEYNEKHERWGKPLAEFPTEEIRKWLTPFHQTFQNVRTATYRERCEWDWRLEDIEGPDLFLFILEEIQEARSVARLLVLKARLEIKEGKFDEALLTLRDGYQLAVNVSEEPLLINGLVGVAIAAMMNEVVIDWIDQPDAPNLYWAAAALPKPLVDMRPALAFEAGACERVLTFLKDAETVERAPDEWLRLISTQLEKLHQLSGAPNATPTPWEKATFIAALPGAYTHAKRELIAVGFDAKKLDAMPVGQVLAIQSRRATMYTSQEILKHAIVDAPDAAERIAETDKRLRAEGWLSPPLQGKDPFGVAGLILPAISTVPLASHRLQRNIAAIQALEALRMHVAQTGRLPATWDDIKVVPVPLNPATATPFPYKLDGAKATFELPQVRFPADGAVYTLEIAGK